MNIVVFDSETTNIDKPFCYNIGYKIVNVETDTTLLKRDYVVEQVWHNPMLFTTAYYADKRPLYVKRMRAKQTIMDKYGYITQQMIRDFKNFNVELAFAYNSPFDTRVIDYNCEWFKTNNPFDNIPIRDIRGFVHRFIAYTKEFQNFCDNESAKAKAQCELLKKEYKLTPTEELKDKIAYFDKLAKSFYTESGNYSTTAETLYRYITNNTEFEEEHTALADSEIEWEILKYCLQKGADITQEYKTYSSIKTNRKQELEIVLNGTSTKYEYTDRRDYKNKNGNRITKIILKNN